MGAKRTSYSKTYVHFISPLSIKFFIYSKIRQPALYGVYFDGRAGQKTYFEVTFDSVYAYASSNNTAPCLKNFSSVLSNNSNGIVFTTQS